MSGTDTACPPPKAAPPERRGWVRWADFLCRYLLAAVFLMAGVTKVTDLRRFEDQVVLQASLSGSDHNS